MKVVATYAQCLEYGTQHVYEALPRLLTIWLEFGTAVVATAAASSQAGRTADKAQSRVDPLKTKLAEMTSNLCKSLIELRDHRP
jgi:hypothetical protein